MKRFQAMLGATGAVALLLLAGNDVASGQGGLGVQAFSAVVITEIATHGREGPHDEFVELKNLSSEPQPLGGHELEYAGDDGRIVPLHAFPSDFVLRPNAVHVVAGRNFSGPREVVNQFVDDSVDLPELFALRLTGPGGVMIDDCSTIPRPKRPWKPWGPCPCPPAPCQRLVDQSITRVLLTGENARDFYLDVRTPGTSALLPQDPIPA